MNLYVGVTDGAWFKKQLSMLSKNDAFGTSRGTFLDPGIELSPAGIDNHAIGIVCEEPGHRFNEECNEEAGGNWTPRDAVREGLPEGFPVGGAA